MVGLQIGAERPQISSVKQAKVRSPAARSPQPIIWLLQRCGTHFLLGSPPLHVNSSVCLCVCVFMSPQAFCRCLSPTRCPFCSRCGWRCWCWVSRTAQSAARTRWSSPRTSSWTRKCLVSPDWRSSTQRSVNLLAGSVRWTWTGRNLLCSKPLHSPTQVPEFACCAHWKLLSAVKPQY